MQIRRPVYTNPTLYMFRFQLISQLSYSFFVLCSQMCNEWAIDTPCPAGGRDFCRSLHILDSRGNSVLASTNSSFFFRLLLLPLTLDLLLETRRLGVDAINSVVAKKY